MAPRRLLLALLSVGYGVCAAGCATTRRADLFDELGDVCGECFDACSDCCEPVALAPFPADRRSLRLEAPLREARATGAQAF